MRRAYYFFCLVPAMLLLVVLLAPSDWPQGGRALSFHIGLVIAITISSVVLSAIGLLWIGLALAIGDRKSKLGLFVASMSSAVPGVILGLLVYLNG
jgi:ABC-type tungstate transport system substrate-binding protein